MVHLSIAMVHLSIAMIGTFINCNDGYIYQLPWVHLSIAMGTFINCHGYIYLLQI